MVRGYQVTIMITKAGGEFAPVQRPDLKKIAVWITIRPVRSLHKGAMANSTEFAIGEAFSCRSNETFFLKEVQLWNGGNGAQSD